MEELKEFLNKSAKSAGLDERWIEPATELLGEASAQPEELQKYLKFKCLVSPDKSSRFDGLVFTKAPFNERMKVEFVEPKLLLWEGNLDLKNAELSSIESSGANVVLVENSAAMEYLPYFILRSKKVIVFADMEHRLKRFSCPLSSCKSVECVESKEKPLVYFGGCQSQTILLRGSCIDDLKVMKRILKTGYNMLRNRLLSSQFFVVSLPNFKLPLVKNMEERSPEITVREDEVSSYIAYGLRKLENGSAEPNFVGQHNEKFKELRRKFKWSEEDYLASLSRCSTWDAKGGKSGAVFARTRDECLIVKEISEDEYNSFAEFGFKYFEYLNSSSKTCIAKIFGMYELTLGKPKYLMVMENLGLERSFKKQYDLKGSSYGRLNPESAEVLMDQNFVNDTKNSRLLISPSSKLNLELAIQNDTEFLAGVNVMDYSLLLGVDEKNEEVVCGIIDYLYPYNFSKKVESFAKSAVMMCKEERPTVISPYEYRDRFLEFMDKNILKETKGIP